MEQILNEKYDLIIKLNKGKLHGFKPINTNEIKTFYFELYPKRIYNLDISPNVIYNLDMYKKDTITFRDLLFITKSEKYEVSFSCGVLNYILFCNNIYIDKEYCLKISLFNINNIIFFEMCISKLYANITHTFIKLDDFIHDLIKYINTYKIIVINLCGIENLKMCITKYKIYHIINKILNSILLHIPFIFIKYKYFYNKIILNNIYVINKHNFTNKNNFIYSKIINILNNYTYDGNNNNIGRVNDNPVWFRINSIFKIINNKHNEILYYFIMYLSII